MFGVTKISSNLGSVSISEVISNSAVLAEVK